MLPKAATAVGRATAYPVVPDGVAAENRRFPLRATTT